MFKLGKLSDEFAKFYYTTETQKGYTEVSECLSKILKLFINAQVAS